MKISLNFWTEIEVWSFLIYFNNVDTSCDDKKIPNSDKKGSNADTETFLFPEKSNVYTTLRISFNE